MRRIALFADVHGNSVALDAVLDDIRVQGGVDDCWVLGDLAAIGFDPIGVLERLSRLPAATFVRGNTDRYLVTGQRPRPTQDECQRNPALWPTRVEVAAGFSWTHGAVTTSGWVSWLAQLPLESRTVLPDGTRVLCVHASPGNDEGQGLHPGVSAETLSAMAASSGADLVCVGHTHWPMDVRVAAVHLVNVGSVSNCYSPDLRASYVLLEADASGYRLQHRRVAYDREAVIAGLRQVNHPAADYIIGFMRGEHRPYWRP